MKTSPPAVAAILLAAISFAAAASANPESDAPLKPLTLAQWAADPRLKEILYPNFKGHTMPESESGAISKLNQDWEQAGKTGKWFIEEQKNSGDFMQLGVGLNDPAIIEASIKSVQWGLAQMKPDGSFDCPDAIHSTELFLEGAARADLILSELHPVPNSGEILQDWNPKLLKIARWMITARAAQSPIDRQKSLERYNHRFFVTAGAFGMVADLAPAPDLTKESESYIRQGLAKERAGTGRYTGAVFPENGGFDCNYQAVSALMMLRCYCVCQNPELKKALAHAALLAIDSIADRINENGDIDMSDSTRVNGQEKTRNNVRKHFSYKDYLMALVAADLIQPSDHLRQIIQLIAPKFKSPDLENIL